MNPESTFQLACPVCRGNLEAVGTDRLCCPVDDLIFDRVEGIWRFLTGEQLRQFKRFLREYEHIRRAEGRGSRQAEYYRALPYTDLTGRFSSDWALRSRSFELFLEKVLAPLEDEGRQSLKILDLGAGCGWLSNRLAARGHRLAAVDLSVDPLDGLGACVHYVYDFLRLQAGYDRIPVAEAQADLAVFNASFHYSVDYEVTLKEALRVLRPGGRVVILDTPLYRRGASGEQMVREREALFERRYGFPSNAIRSENYLTPQRLQTLGEQLNLDWQLFFPAMGLKQKLRSMVTSLRLRREVAHFPVLAGRRRDPGQSR